MRISDVLRDIGRPVAYYPGLAKPLGGVKAAVLFCQIFYWHSRAQHELGVHKTSEELTDETGLSYEEQRAARKSLKQVGVLIETEKRLEHKIYFRIDEDALERLIETTRGQHVGETGGNSPKSAKPENPNPPNGKSPFREMDEAESADRSEPSPPRGQTLDRGEGDSQVVNGVKTTAEITAESSSNARAREAVDNSTDDPPPDSLLLPEIKKTGKPAARGTQSAEDPPPSVEELVLLGALRELKDNRGKGGAISLARDRPHLAAWAARKVPLDQLREAYRRAVAARDRDRDDRPVNAGFLARFVDEMLAPAAARSDDHQAWFETPDGVDAHGKELKLRERKPDEDWRYYRVLVAKAARDHAAVEFVLRDAQRFNAVDLYQFARTTFGDALMPVDDYAS